MSNSKNHAKKLSGRSSSVRRRKNASRRKRRGTFLSNLSFSFKALCVLIVIFAVIAALPNPPAKAPVVAEAAGDAYAAADVMRPESAPSVEVLAPESPQGGAAVTEDRNYLAQYRPTFSPLSGGYNPASLLPNQQRPTRTPITVTPTPVPRTPEPTVEPTATPPQGPTMQPAMDSPLKNVIAWEVLDGIPQTDQPLGLRENERVDDSYFNDTIFIGDSVTQKLQQYVTNRRKNGESTLLGNARFIAIQSLGTHTALAAISDGSLHPTIMGIKMTLEDALVQLEAKKVYIMLGMNDVAVSGMDTSISNMMKLLKRIQNSSPNIEIFVQSATPRLSGSQPTTEQLFDYDVRVYEEILKLDDPRIHFVDVAYVMRDDSGKLYESYCSDKDGMALHFTNAGCEQWVEYLYTHADT